MSDNPPIETVGDDLFERLGLPDAAEIRARVDLAFLIVQECEQRGLKQMEAAELLGISQSDFSKLANARIDGFSQERLERLLNRLGFHVRIQVGPRPAGEKKASVAVEAVDRF